MKIFFGISLLLGCLNIANASLYDFNSGLAGFQSFGSASHDGNRVKIAPGAGSVFLNNTINSTNFNASFDIFIGGGSGADGMTFAWVKTAGVGQRGGGLGFQGLEGYSVEFDTFRNFRDISENHIGLNKDGHVVSLVAVDVPELEDTGWHHIDVSLALDVIQVKMDGIEYINRSLPGFYRGFDAYFGFTASTGLYTNEHYVDNFSIEISAVPVPAAVWLFSSCLVGIIGMRKKHGQLET